MDEQPARMSQAAYGRARELSRQRVGQLVKDGRVPLDEDGLVMVEQADANLAAMLDRRKANRSRQIALAAQAGVVYPAPVCSAQASTPGIENAPAASLLGAVGQGGDALPAGSAVSPSAQRQAGPQGQAVPAGSSGSLLDPETGRPFAGSGEAADRPDDKPQAAANEANSYWAQKTRREKIEADRADLSYRKSLGELVDADEVARSRFNTAQQVANALLQIPARIAPVVAPSDPQRAERLMTEEIKRVINELAGDLDQPVSAGDAERQEARAA